MTVVAIQARTGSKRFPGKILEDINGDKMYQLVYTRCKQAKTVDEVLFLPSREDKVFLKELEETGTPYYETRAKEDNVLGRYSQLLKDNPSIEYCVRITGDCPLVMPDLIDIAVVMCRKSGGFATNVKHRTYPKGLDVECFSREYFLTMCDYIAMIGEVEKRRLWEEHVTKCIYDTGLLARSIEMKEDLHKINVSVDTKKDLYRVRNIYKKYPFKALLLLDTAIDCIKNECGFDEHTNAT